MNEKYLRLPEIAEMTGISIDTLRWYRSVGRGPEMFRLGRRVVATEADVVAWIEGERAAQGGHDA